jgi:transcriptional regulator with XRE-family HTH domain
MIESGNREKGHRARNFARGSHLFRVTEDILVAMEDLGVTKTELAKRLDISKPRVTQLLGGSSNMTIGTLSDIAFELGLSLDKTFKEYSVQRERLATCSPKEQSLNEPGYAVSSFKSP